MFPHPNSIWAASFLSHANPDDVRTKNHPEGLLWSWRITKCRRRKKTQQHLFVIDAIAYTVYFLSSHVGSWFSLSLWTSLHPKTCYQRACLLREAWQNHICHHPCCEWVPVIGMLTWGRGPLGLFQTQTFFDSSAALTQSPLLFFF